MIDIRCSNCGQPFPQQGIPYRCPTCSGFFNLISLPEFNPSQVDDAASGLWRYSHAIGIPTTASFVTLGEGNTPLVWKKTFNHDIGYKLEFLNPTGSFKDRGSAVLVSYLNSQGVQEAVEDSSGNAGASFAAYASAAGMRASVFVPEYASGPKRLQISAYGAELVPVPGNRSKTTEIAIKAVEEGAVYASHVYMPYGLAGYATLAFELYEQLGKAPGTIIIPVGQGGLLLGVYLGFRSLHRADLIEKMPSLIGVQAMACAPLWTAFEYGSSGIGWVSEGDTLAEGVRVLTPLRGDAVLQAVAESGGRIVAVEEQNILPGRSELAKLGFFVEPTSALVWNALEQVLDFLQEPVVVVLTGAGLKSP